MTNDEARAFLAYANDPESDLETVLTIEDALGIDWEKGQGG